MRVEGAQQAAGKASDFGRDFGREQHEAAAPESRALVVTARPAAPQTSPVYRQAAFLAHLIATKDQAPQTRERRRAEPSEAIAAYRSAGALTPL
jgi:hypothetical protein